MGGGVGVTGLNYIDSANDGGTIPISATSRAVSPLRLQGLDIAQQFALSGEQVTQTINKDTGYSTTTNMADMSVAGFARFPCETRSNTFTFTHTTSEEGETTVGYITDAELHGYPGSMYGDTPRSNAYGLVPGNSYLMEKIRGIMMTTYANAVLTQDNLKTQAMYDAILVDTGATTPAPGTAASVTWTDEVTTNVTWTTDMTSTTTTPAEKGQLIQVNMGNNVGSPYTKSPSYNWRTPYAQIFPQLASQVESCLSSASSTTFRRGAQISDGSFTSPNKTCFTNSGINYPITDINNLYTSTVTETLGYIICPIFNKDCFMWFLPLMYPPRTFFSSIAELNNYIPGYTSIGVDNDVTTLARLNLTNDILMGSTMTVDEIGTNGERFDDVMISRLRMAQGTQWLDQQAGIMPIDPRSFRMVANKQPVSTGDQSLGLVLYLYFAVSCLRVFPKMIWNMLVNPAFVPVTYSNPLTVTMSILRANITGNLSKSSSKFKMDSRQKDRFSKMIWLRGQELKDDIQAARDGKHKYYSGVDGERGNPHTNYLTLVDYLTHAFGHGFEEELTPKRYIRDVFIDTPQTKKTNATKVEKTGASSVDLKDLGFIDG